MTQLNLQTPVINQAFSTEAVKVDNNFTTIQSWANGNIDGTNVAATLTGRRLIAQAQAFVGPSTGSATTFFVGNDGLLVASTGNVAKAIYWWMLDPSNFAVTGKSNTQLVLRFTAAQNGTVPGVNIGAQLNAFTVGGSGGNVAFTMGSVVSGSAVSIGSNNNDTQVVETAPFTFPSTGNYAAVISMGGTTATNSAASFMYQLYVLNS